MLLCNAEAAQASAIQSICNRKALMRTPHHEIDCRILKHRVFGPALCWCQKRSRERDLRKQDHLMDGDSAIVFACVIIIVIRRSI
jgi:hypothetical protein